MYRFTCNAIVKLNVFFSRFVLAVAFFSLKTLFHVHLCNDCIFPTGKYVDIDSMRDSIYENSTLKCLSRKRNASERKRASIES